MTHEQYMYMGLLTTTLLCLGALLHKGLAFKSLLVFFLAGVIWPGFFTVFLMVCGAVYDND